MLPDKWTNYEVEGRVSAKTIRIPTSRLARYHAELGFCFCYIYFHNSAAHLHILFLYITTLSRPKKMYKLVPKYRPYSPPVPLVRSHFTVSRKDRSVCNGKALHEFLNQICIRIHKNIAVIKKLRKRKTRRATSRN